MVRVEYLSNATSRLPQIRNQRNNNGLVHADRVVCVDVAVAQYTKTRQRMDGIVPTRLNGGCFPRSRRDNAPK
jgi:hypothetical protein